MLKNARRCSQIPLWCRFPDQLYTDSTAVDEGLFDGIWDGFEFAWRNVPGLRVDAPRRLAILDGRAHNRPQGPSASQSVSRHGGLPITEMLTPWLVLGPVGSI